MEKITIKKGLEYQDDYFYISDPEIASCFLAVDVDGDITYSVNQITYETLASEKSCSLKIHKSGVAEQLKPVEGEDAIDWRPRFPMEERSIHVFRGKYLKQKQWKYIKASSLTININIEMLNKLMEVLNENN